MQPSSNPSFENEPFGQEKQQRAPPQTKERPTKIKKSSGDSSPTGNHNSRNTRSKYKMHSAKLKEKAIKMAQVEGVK